jgi:ribonucleoside-diphosphate reductase alpha chain
MTATVNHDVATGETATEQEHKQGIRWTRVFSPTEDPYEDIEMELDDVVLRNHKTGEAFWEDREVLFPKAWSRNAREITSQHYLRGPLGSPEREKSVLVMINRVVDWIVDKAMNGRPEADRSESGPLFVDWDSARAFAADLKRLIVKQKANFNSPVWYNIGVAGVAQQPSACFILEVADTMASILNWYVEEGTIFKGGSGAGTNLGRVRSSYEGLSKGGWASGPPSYMCGADASAGTMKSGGRSRRAAKMVVLPIDHPDIYQQANGAEGFIRLKAKAERVARTLRDAGFDVSVDSGVDSIHVQFQNANNSVRLTDEFMEAVLEGRDWQTIARSQTVKKELPKYKARFLWREIAQASWDCADPGLQFDTTSNYWHSTPAAGRINASNPCSEYMHLDNSPCNLAATNLLSFLGEDGSWDADGFAKAVEVVAIAQTVMAAFGDYPTEKIRKVATGFRQIGQGYTNLGAMLMSNGLAYDSADGRAWNAAITALMQATIFQTSAKVAAVWGAYRGVVSADPAEALPGFDHPENRQAHLRVAEMHRQFCRAIGRAPSSKGRRLSQKLGQEAHIDIFHSEVVGAGVPVRSSVHLRSLWRVANSSWDGAIELGNRFGFANAHMSVLAPMGTNGYMMDNDTTGIEPGLALKVSKKKVDGSWMSIVNQSVPRALRRLGYSVAQTDQIVAYIDEHNSVVGAPDLREEHYSVFDTSFEEAVGGRYLSWMAHLLQMAAAQPFLSGAISKTVNGPESMTVEEVESIHMQAWRLGLKAVAIYRNNCKATQPLAATKKEQEALAGPPPSVRHKLPRKAKGGRIKLRIVDPGMGEFEMYALYSTYPDGSFGEIFEIAGAEGTLVNGLLAWGAKLLSGAAQHGMPMRDVIKLGLNMSFPPSASMISPKDSDFTSCTSIIDLLCRELALEFLTTEERHELGIFTRVERTEAIESAYNEPVQPTGVGTAQTLVNENGNGQVKLTVPFSLANAAMCFKCGIPMRPNGTCYSCPQCGSTTGCS